MRFEDDALVVEGGGRAERALKLDLPIDDRSVILRTVQKLFDGMTALDTDAMRSVLDPEARLVHTFTRDGVPRHARGLDERLLVEHREPHQADARRA